MSKKLMLLSIDALQTGDLPFLKKLPNFSKVLDRAAVVKNVREVYPTLTNVNHVSMVTGFAADRHGVYHNMLPFLPAGSLGWNVIGANWFWRSDYIKTPPLLTPPKQRV